MIQVTVVLPKLSKGDSVSTDIVRIDITLGGGFQNYRIDLVDEPIL